MKGFLKIALLQTLYSGALWVVKDLSVYLSVYAT